MALRCYFPETEAAAVSPTIDTAAGQWDSGHTGSQVRRRLRFDADSSTLTSTAYTPDGADHSGDYNTHHRQYVSDSLPAQTIAAGTWKAQFQGTQPNANCNQRLTIKIYVVSSDGGTVRGILSAITRDGDNEWATALTNRAISGNISELTIQANDRLVVEVGTGGNPGSGSGTQGHNATIRFGCNASTGDLPEDDASALTTRRPWIEFSSPIFTNAVRGTDTLLVALGEAGAAQTVVVPPSFLQAVKSTQGSGNRTMVITPNAAGTLLVVIAQGGPEATAPSISDTQTHNWSPASFNPGDDSHSDRLVAWWAVAKGNTQTTITVAPGGSNYTWAAVVAEYGNVGDLVAGDVQGFVQYTGTTATDGIHAATVTTNYDLELVIAWIADASRADEPVAGTGWTGRASASEAAGTIDWLWEDKVNVAQGQVIPTATDTTYGADDWCTCTLAFRVGTAEAATPVADVDTLGIGLVEAGVAATIGLLVQAADLLGISLAEVAQLVVVATLRDSDALNAALAEYAFVTDISSTQYKTGTDVLSIALILSSYATDILVGTPLGVRLSETARVSGTLQMGDALAVSLLETARIIVALQQQADLLGVSLAEAASVAMGTLPLQDADALGIGLTDLATVFGTLVQADTVATALGERAVMFATLQQGDTALVSLTDLAAILVMLQQQADTLGLSLAEVASVAMGVLQMQDADLVGVSLAELAAVYGALQASDTANVALVESQRLLVTVQQGEALAVLLSERADLQVRLEAALDTLALGLVEDGRIAAIVQDVDALRLALGEAGWYTGAALILGTDTLGIGLAEGPAAVMAWLQVSDTVAAALGERVPPIFVTVSDADPLVLTLVEQVSMFVTAFSQDVLSVSLQEGAPAIGQVSYIQAADLLGIGLGEAAAIARALQAVDSLGIRLTEFSTILGTVMVADLLAVSLSEGAGALLVSQTVADALGISLATAEAVVGAVRALDALGVSLADAALLANSIQDIDRLAVALRENAGAIYAVTHLWDREVLAVRLEEVAAILAATPGQIGRALVATLESRVPLRTLTPATLYDVLGPLRWPYTVERA